LLQKRDCCTGSIHPQHAQSLAVYEGVAAQTACTPTIRHHKAYNRQHQALLHNVGAQCHPTHLVTGGVSRGRTQHGHTGPHKNKANAKAHKETRLLQLYLPQHCCYTLCSGSATVAKSDLVAQAIQPSPSTSAARAQCTMLITAAAPAPDGCGAGALLAVAGAPWVVFPGEGEGALLGLPTGRGDMGGGLAPEPPAAGGGRS